MLSPLKTNSFLFFVCFIFFIIVCLYFSFTFLLTFFPQINDLVAGVLLRAMSKQQSVSLSEFKKFDWAHFLPSLEQTLEKIKEEEKIEKERLEEARRRAEEAKKKAEKDRIAYEKRAKEEVEEFGQNKRFLVLPSTYVEFISLKAMPTDYHFYITKIVRTISLPLSLSLSYLLLYSN